MDRPPTFSADALARAWTEHSKPSWRRWSIVAIVSVGLHVALAGWLLLRDVTTLPSTVGARTSAIVAPAASRSMTITVITPPIRAAPPARDDALNFARALASPSSSMARPTVIAGPRRRDARPPSAATPATASAAPTLPTARRSTDPTVPNATSSLSTSSAPQSSAASPPSRAVGTSPQPLDLSLTRTPSMQRNAGSEPTQQRVPWPDDLRRPATPNGALTERRTNDGVQLRRGEDCVEIRQSRQAALDPFSAAERPAARGLQPCD